MTDLRYRRILLKLSGEALLDQTDHGIDLEIIQRLGEEIRQLLHQGVEIAIVIGGGNLFRGAKLTTAGMNQVTADHIGMLATVMNALAIQDTFLRLNIDSCVLSALAMPQVCELYTRDRVLYHFRHGRVPIFAAGTGNPCFTTDSAASLRAIEIGADLLIKATKVDGIYSSDPCINPDATFYSSLTYDEIVMQKLAVMDMTAVVLCRDYHIPLCVMNIYHPGALARIAAGQAVGSLVV
jgi:uridylate kinase